MKKRNSILARVGIVALVLTLVTSTMTSGTLAKYTGAGSATVTALVAKWDPSIAIGDNADVMTEAGVINLFDTYVGNTLNHVNGSVIAPGMGGNFKVTVNAGESDVNINYSVYMFYKNDTTATFPQNFTFAAGSGSTAKPAHGVNTTTFNSYVDGTLPTGTDGQIGGGTLEVNASDPEEYEDVTVTWNWEYNTPPSGTGSTQASMDELDNTAGYGALTNNKLEYCIVVVLEQVNPTAALPTT